MSSSSSEASSIATSTGLLTLLAMLAFAANSLLCRLALGPALIDAATFAAFGGVVLLAEAITPRLILASVATLGGVWIVLAQRAAPGR